MLKNLRDKMILSLIVIGSFIFSNCSYLKSSMEKQGKLVFGFNIIVGIAIVVVIAFFVYRRMREDD